FYGWGGKFVMPGDTETAGAILAQMELPERRFDIVLEGGAIEHDGAGTLLTTRACLFNANRNPGWEDTRARRDLSAIFGAEDIIFLEDGLIGDHTDGHIDNIARFIGHRRVVCQRPSGEDDPNAERLLQIERDLRSSGLDIVTIPSPGRVQDSHRQVLPASHLNFVFANGLVVMPVFGSTYGPRAEIELQRHMPNHRVVGLPANHILTGGGAFHCATQQVPARPIEEDLIQ
ncbi:MAG: agmatine deiminase family protein, partial [Pseudomonadota bacterium]